MLILGLLLMQSVDYVKCNQEQLILANEEMTYDIDFFNVIFYEASGRLEACRILNEAEVIQIEEEKYALNAYYIYVDGKILQEILVENEIGKQKVNYVGYLHNFEKKDQKVIVNYNNMSRKNRSIYILGGLFLFVLFSLAFAFAWKV